MYLQAHDTANFVLFCNTSTWQLLFFCWLLTRSHIFLYPPTVNSSENNILSHGGLRHSKRCVKLQYVTFVSSFSWLSFSIIYFPRDLSRRIVANLRGKKRNHFPCLHILSFSLFPLCLPLSCTLNGMARAAKLLLLWLQFKRCQLKQALSATVLRLWPGGWVLVWLCCENVWNAAAPRFHTFTSIDRFWSDLSKTPRQFFST